MHARSKELTHFCNDAAVSTRRRAGMGRCAVDKSADVSYNIIMKFVEMGFSPRHFL